MNCFVLSTLISAGIFDELQIEIFFVDFFVYYNVQFKKKNQFVVHQYIPAVLSP